MQIRRMRPGADYLPLYARYIARVPDGDVLESMRSQIGETAALLRSMPATLAHHSYAHGKWTVSEVIGHVMDVERVMSYRALRFARGDDTALPGFDQNLYVPAGDFDRRPLAGLVDELIAVRAATVALFDGLAEAAWTRVGVASGQQFTVAGLAWVIAGHELHHRHLLETRYLAPPATA